MSINLISHFNQIISNDFKEDNSLFSWIIVILMIATILIYLYKHINDIFISWRKNKIDSLEDIKTNSNDEILDKSFKKFLILYYRAEKFKDVTNIKVDPYLVEHILKVYHYSKGEINLYTLRMARTHLCVRNNRLVILLDQYDFIGCVLFGIFAVVFLIFAIILLFLEGNLIERIISGILSGMIFIWVIFLVREIAVYISAKRLKDYLEQYGNKIYDIS